MSNTEQTMKILSNMAKQVRSLLNIEDISLDPRIGIAMQFAAKYRKDIVFKVHIFQEGHKNLRNLHCQFDTYCIASNRR